MIQELAEGLTLTILSRWIDFPHNCKVFFFLFLWVK